MAIFARPCQPRLGRRAPEGSNASWIVFGMKKPRRDDSGGFYARQGIEPAVAADFARYLPRCNERLSTGVNR